MRRLPAPRLNTLKKYCNLQLVPFPVFVIKSNSRTGDFILSDEAFYTMQRFIKKIIKHLF